MPRFASIEKKLVDSIEGEVRFDNATLAIYSTDASNYRQVPVGVVIPRHEEDVIRALEIARENAIPLLARGGGTSLAGQACNAALVLDFSKYMNRVVAVDAERRLAVVEPGVVQSQLNAAAAAHGLFFAPDPATKDRCTIGGMIGNNSCGAHSAAYGKTVDNLAALDAILYDGTRLSLGGQTEAELPALIGAGGRIGELYRSLRELREGSAGLVRDRYPKIPRRVSGYNLDELLPENGFNLARALVGSEGTLAVTTRAALQLAARPKNLAMAVLGFDDVFIAADQTPWILEHRPQALEGFDHHLVDFGMSKKLESLEMLPQGRTFLIAEVGGESADEAAGRAEALRAQAGRTKGCAGVATFLEARHQQAIWRLRQSGLGAGAFIPGHPRSWPGAEDTAVAPARLGPYLRRLAQLLGRYKLEAATYYGHFGEGCVHCRINFDLTTPMGVAQFRAAMHDIADLVAEYGGSLSGEHGDGLARSELLPRIFGPKLTDAFRTFKRIFDPEGRMNPGVIADPYPLDSHLRLGPGYKPRGLKTHFDFSAEDGLAGAALKCVGIGKCRKLESGTMCPSYMVTREEMHSTRGRARLLHEALAGDLLSGGIDDPALHEALDLCLSCKGCKSECPATVDMATYKAEFLSHYYKTHRRPLSGHFFGRVHELARLAMIAPHAVNAVSHNSVLTACIKRMLGVHPARELPRFATQAFRSWFKRHRSPNPNGREVVLFPDTFSNFFEPHVAVAAVGVLERAGFRVAIPPRDLCCGRPLYDQGMLDVAKQRLASAVEVLSPIVARGTKVVGLEPSCVMTFRDELPALFPRSSGTRALAENVLLLDEFIAHDGPDFIPPTLRGDAILHGHCHRKSIAGLDSELALIGRIPGLNVDVPDTGCCGMAGAFGYTEPHHKISQQIGARVLFPAIEKSSPATFIIADGFACRSQIRQFCPGRYPLHLAELLNLGAEPASPAK
jgi:FAD/FMN-containing dehydrogenase/Fe-S oxidoreductase